MPEARTRHVCPICGSPTEQRYRPFCSRRCADIDLHRWLSGVYAVPVTAEEEAVPVTAEEEQDEARRPAAEASD